MSTANGFDKVAIADRYKEDGLNQQESRREFLKRAALAAAAVPLAASAKTVFDGQSAQHRTALAPQMIQIPEYMVYAKLPDGQLIGLLGKTENGHAAARHSSDEGSTWSDTVALFPLDEAIGKWSLHNCFLDKDGELQLLYTNDANTTKNAESISSIHYNIWHVRSRDGRKAWNSPVPVWEGYAGSLLSFAQMRQGRVLIPFCFFAGRSWAKRGDGFDSFTYVGRFSSSATYSDDNGQSWHKSPSELQVQTPNLFSEGAIEPIVIELKDGRIWMLIRSQNGRFYESFSPDGHSWTNPVPTSILSSDSPCSLTRLRDGRIVMLWNNTLRFPYANGGRAVLHGAISEDEGRSWRGYREVAANPLAVEPPPPRGDHGVTYTVPTLTASGKLVTSLSTGPGGGTYLLRVDPEWLYETKNLDDFSGAHPGWSWFGTHGVGVEPHPDDKGRRVLAIRKPDANWPAGAVWNFPAGRRGELKMRVRIASGFRGSQIGLTDHFSVAFDDQDRFWNVFNFTLAAGGSLPDGRRIQPEQWHELIFKWDCDSARESVVQLDGNKVARLRSNRETPGLSYLRIRSIAEADSGGMQVESVAVDVGESWI